VILSRVDAARSSSTVMSSTPSRPRGVADVQRVKHGRVKPNKGT
jgi:hypothetical protein